MDVSLPCYLSDAEVGIEAVRDEGREAWMKGTREEGTGGERMKKKGREAYWRERTWRGRVDGRNEEGRD